MLPDVQILNLNDEDIGLGKWLFIKNVSDMNEYKMIEDYLTDNIYELICFPKFNRIKL